MGNETSRSAWSKTYHEIKTQHDTAYAIIQEAINLDEGGLSDEALEKYKKGIAQIDSVLRIQVTCPETAESTWESACKMIQKMKKTRAEILMRINYLQQQSTELPYIVEEPEEPPSYDEAMSTMSTESTSSDPANLELVTYSDLADALSKIRIDSISEMEAEIIYMYEGVKIYFISPTGEVSSSLQPQTLKIILVESEGENVPRAILQVGNWTYPLIPGVSPCYRNSTEYNAFILPNVYSEIPGSSIGIILPPDTDEAVYEILESILYGIVGEGKPPTPQDLSNRISSGIVTGATYVSRGLVYSAEKLGNLLNTNTPKLISRMDSSDQPTKIPRGVSRTMRVASTATNKAAQVTGFVAEQVGVATVKLGRFLAPHIQKQGTRLLTSGFKMSEQEASAKMDGVLTVAAGAVEGFSTVYRGLENSAGILGESLKNNTVKVVQHKYGQPAGVFAGDTLSTMGNVYQISQNAKVIQPKHLAKRTAKEAGKALVSGHSKPQLGEASTSNSNINKPVSSSTELVANNFDFTSSKKE